jgi:hypothetical protein
VRTDATTERIQSAAYTAGPARDKLSPSCRHRDVFRSVLMRRHRTPSVVTYGVEVAEKAS